MARALRVVLATETFHPEVGGGESQARLLADTLTRRGHQVTVVTRRSRKGLPRHRTEGGVPVVRIPPAGPGRWKKWGLAFTALAPLWRLGGGADAVLVSGFRFLGVPAVLARAPRKGICVLKADSPGELSGEYFRAGLARFGLAPRSPGVRLGIAARNALLRRADGFVAISGEIAEELADHGVPPGRVRRIPNGVDTRRFRPAGEGERERVRERLGLPPGPMAVYTGRLVSYKGLPLLLEVWRELHRGVPEAVLVLVGAGGTDIHACEAELRGYVGANGLDGSVRFAGEAEAVEEYLRAADAFVFPTEQEAFGISLVEAMACGLPCAATPVGGIRDFLEHGRNGLAVEPRDGPQLRDALETLLRGGDGVAALGRAARETVLARFSEDAVADAYLALFEALRRPGGGKP